MKVVDNLSSTADILSTLETSMETGLSEEIANERLAVYGRNELESKTQVNPLTMFLSQFKGVMSILLIVAGLISAATGDLTDTIVIFFVVILNAVMGFVQEYRAEKAISALKKLAVPVAKVIRDGRFQEISSELLAPGDIVKIQAGDLIPADGRLLDTSNLTIEEATLTGESIPVEKSFAESVDPALSIGDRNGDVFMGTTVAQGRGTFVTTSTGMNTELGKIAEIIGQTTVKQTPLQKRLGQLGLYLAIAAVSICIVVFIAGVFQKRGIEEMLLTSISLAVAAVPESLTAVITISLALGAQRMAKQNALIRKLPAVETLGCVTAICSDKTGTLTQNKMQVEYIYAGGNSFKRGNEGFVDVNAHPDSQHASIKTDINIRELFESISLCNDTITQKTNTNEIKLIGDPSETSLIEAAMFGGMDIEEKQWLLPRIKEIPFDSVRKRMTTIHQSTDESIIAFIKGAIDSILPICTSELYDGRPKNLTADRRKELLEESELYAQRGIRIMSAATRTFDAVPDTHDIDNVESNLMFLGFVAISDPLRPEAATAVKKCKEAGIQVRMITGDHKLTAATIGSELGIVNSDSEVCVGSEIETMNDDDLADTVNRCRVYARVSPEHKVKIVSALQHNGHIVAMTGDGVNDAPSLKISDVGVAMGITGTDVSREASDIILTDDNFATIVSAVEEGRTIYDNIRKFVRYTLATNFGEVLTMFFALLLNFPLPLLPIHILWINLVTDGLPALALGVEPAEDNIMKRPPRSPNESLFARGLWQQVVWVGMYMAIGTLIMFSLEVKINGIEYARTMAFYTIAAFQLFNVLAIRRETQSFLKTDWLSNKALLWTVIGTFTLQVMLIYISPLDRIFKLVSIEISDLVICTLVASTVFFAVEFEKYIRRQKISI